WCRRSDEIEAECRRQVESAEEVSRRLRQVEQELAATRADLDGREQAWQAAQEELARQRQELESHGEEAAKQQEEAVGLRRELGRIRRQLSDRHRKRPHRIPTQREAVRPAPRRVSEHTA